MKIGILGGTFNPIHIGHLILAQEARENLGLSKIFFVPTCLPAHKDNSDIAPASCRLAMIRKTISGNKYFFVSDMEIKRGGCSYTIDTIKEFKKRFASDTLYFIIGSDLLKYLDEWKDLSEITQEVEFIAATRPGYPLNKIPSFIKTMAIRAIDVSGFEIRKAIKDNKSFRYLVPDAVYKYILKKKLYI
ncbi:MAG: nicotinate-nucleotide adenylyltransferase [Candidatus Omnitrophota bacterium]|nr:nicotinate-nucleotide adenylyltransferase [Candidatus Omnitrophota bacterium]